MSKFISFLIILTLWNLLENPQLNKPYQMPRGVPAQNINTSVGIQSLHGLGVEFHVPAVSNCPDHFKLSLLESPNSSFSYKNSDFSAICSHNEFQYLRILQIKNIFSKTLPRSTHCHHSSCVACIRYDSSHRMTIHLFQ